MIELIYKYANIDDVDLYFRWSNDPLVRKNSFKQDIIDYTNHVKWFTNKLESKDCYFYLFLNTDNIPVGQVRIDKDKSETIIGLSVDEKFRGMSIGVEMLKMACNDYLTKHIDEVIVAYIKETNISSYKLFEKVGFTNLSKTLYSGNATFRLIKQLT